MSKYVEMIFTETNLMTKEQFLLLGGIPTDIEGSIPPRIKENDIAGDTTAAAADELNFTDLPDFGQPLPDVSLRELKRLTSLRRGQWVSCQRGHQQRFLEIWHSRSPGNQV